MAFFWAKWLYGCIEKSNGIMMNNINLVAVVFYLTLTGCGGNSSKESSSTTDVIQNVTQETTPEHYLIRAPSQIDISEEILSISKEAGLNVEIKSSQQLDSLNIDIFESQLSKLMDIPIDESGTVLNINLVDSENAGKIGHYSVIVNSHGIEINTSNEEGAFYALQTIKQLLIHYNQKDLPNIELPYLVIEDEPKYQYRGAMLDVARHFFSINTVKGYIDHLAYYKFNKLHLHLTDDQGWRIEIKSWPNLTMIGGSTEVGGGDGGFYTQEQFSELVNYAKERFITIIPEIDMPGHTNAALASYDELNCDGNAPELYTGFEVGFSSLCIEKELTYTFISDVINEVAELTEGKYIHIGGDESLVTTESDYKYFIERAEAIVTATGKKLIGWEEVSQVTTNTSSVIQFWKESEHLEKAVENGIQVIISPAEVSYLDMKYNSNTDLGLTWAGLINTEKAYRWLPSDYVSQEHSHLIKGIEAPLWSETISNEDDIEFMVFPRLSGYAEIAWSTNTNNEWNEYRVRLANQKKYFEITNINYYQTPLIDW